MTAGASFRAGPSRGGTVYNAALCVAMVLGGIWLTGQPDERTRIFGLRTNTVGWGCVIFFGAGFPLSIWQLITRRAAIIADDEGLRLRPRIATDTIGPIYWHEIESFEATPSELVVHIAAPGEVRRHGLPPSDWLRQADGQRHVLIEAHRLGASTEEVAQRLALMRRERLPA